MNRECNSTIPSWERYAFLFAETCGTCEKIVCCYEWRKTFFENMVAMRSILYEDFRDTFSEWMSYRFLYTLRVYVCVSVCVSIHRLIRCYVSHLYLRKIVWYKFCHKAGNIRILTLIKIFYAQFYEIHVRNK